MYYYTAVRVKYYFFWLVLLFLGLLQRRQGVKRCVSGGEGDGWTCTCQECEVHYIYTLHSTMYTVYTTLCRSRTAVHGGAFSLSHKPQNVHFFLVFIANPCSVHSALSRFLWKQRNFIALLPTVCYARTSRFADILSYVIVVLSLSLLIRCNSKHV